MSVNLVFLRNVHTFDLRQYTSNVKIIQIRLHIYFRVQNIFRITYGANTLNLPFRIDPETFFINDPQIRIVKGFFYHHVKRRIHITSDNLDLIMD